MPDWMFPLLFLAVAAAIFLGPKAWRRHRRRTSLRRLDDGSYSWIGLNGALMFAALHPGEAGGAWEREDHSVTTSGHHGGGDHGASHGASGFDGHDGGGSDGGGM